MVKIVIVGCGINGLSSAIRIQDEFPAAEITIISDKFTPETTSDGAAGIWGPYLLGTTPANDVYRWSKETHNFLRDTWKSPEGGLMGVSMLPCFRVSSDDDFAVPDWSDVVYGFRSLTQQELQKLGKPSLKKGYGFVTFTCEGRKLLPYLLNKFKMRGGQILKAKVQDLHTLGKAYDIVVNCTGLAARDLVPDETVQPKRGQIIRVNSPDIKWAILNDDDDGNYIIPNQDSVVLGGTHQEGDWNCTTYQEDTTFIKTGCAAIIPSVQDAPLIREWVGLRPGRPSVRLDMEVIQHPGEKPWFLCSNYGHGGSGLTLFWGCAKDTADLVKTATQMYMQSKL
ncbi:D-aspartate oxidase [Folsomia candida]|uniref:D-aspartate oxidase n=1 Tax=Folsomia candida TaxID=158441 RepID=UPI000B8F6209|nr:D-aspartate oxidase [Folsomia candida]